MSIESKTSSYTRSPPEGATIATVAGIASKASVESAATATAVLAYHPLRTIAQQSMAKQSFSQIDFSFKNLYKGLVYSCLGAHQLFLMSFFNTKLKEIFCGEEQKHSRWVDIGIGMVSGALSSVSATPFEA